MASDQLPIRFAQVEKARFRIEPEGYKLFSKPKSAWKGWLAKQLWKVLMKLGALEQYWTFTETYSYTHKHQEVVTKAILKHIDYLLDGGEKIEDYSIIIGGSTFYELTDLMIRNGLMSFPLGAVRFGNDDGESRYMYEFRGIPIHVVPHMEGIAIVPKVLIEKDKKGSPPRDFELTAKRIEDDPETAANRRFLRQQAENFRSLNVRGGGL